MQIKLGNNIDSFAREILQLGHIDLSGCYQCGKCTAGCTVGKFISDSPTRIIRLIQLNQKDEVLNSKTPYLCASCMTCSARCPMEIDIAGLMETLRIISSSEGRPSPVKSVSNFSTAFLNSVKVFGRLFEFGMTVDFNLRNLTPLQNAELGPEMLKKHKLSLFPQNKSDRKRLRQIFAQSKKLTNKD